MKNVVNLEYKDDYVQSANTLFHFMKQRDFLFKAIDNCALFPRYCIEDVEYMGLSDSLNKQIKEIAVLQKCFCDIPLHKLTEKFDIHFEKNSSISGEELQRIDENDFNTHTKCYGEFAIGFAKSWSVKHGLQPVLYINGESDFLQDFRRVFNHIMNRDDVDDIFVDDLLARMAFMKPLRGIMKRSVDGRTISLDKNFHDEKEWRFIPDEEFLRDKNLERVIAKKTIQANLTAINRNIEMPSYSPIWLKFEYEDIKYIIVPNHTEKLALIEHIIDRFGEDIGRDNDKYILISKILVLDDIRRDW